MTVASILRDKGRDVVTVHAKSSLAETCDVLASHRIGAVIVLHADQSIAGILSERDVVRAIARLGGQGLASTVDQHMTRDVKTCVDSDTIEHVMQTMTAGRFRHLPVVRDGKLAGLISIGDVVKRRIEQAEREAADMRAYITAA
jgi:CBS domain-containing protein